MGGKVECFLKREYGKVELSCMYQLDFFLVDVFEGFQVWMLYGDMIMEIFEQFELLVGIVYVDVVAYKFKIGVFVQLVYCIQFYLEVLYSLDGMMVFKNFVKDIVGCYVEWIFVVFVEEMV